MVKPIDCSLTKRICHFYMNIMNLFLIPQGRAEFERVILRYYSAYRQVFNMIVHRQVTNII